jgi:hypothetical protein
VGRFGGGVGHFGGSHIAGLRGEHFRHARGPFIGGGGFYNYGYDCPYYPPYRYSGNDYDCAY